MVHKFKLSINCHQSYYSNFALECSQHQWLHLVNGISLRSPINFIMYPKLMSFNIVRILSEFFPYGKSLSGVIYVLTELYKYNLHWIAIEFVVLYANKERAWLLRMGIVLKHSALPNVSFTVFTLFGYQIQFQAARHFEK